jgi:hypothetical protein
MYIAVTVVIGEEDQGAAWYVFMVDLIKKLNTRTKQNKQNSSVWCRHTKTENNYPQTQVGTGYLSMVLNQRQRLPAASEWEPYQAKHIEIQNLDYKT